MCLVQVLQHKWLTQAFNQSSSPAVLQLWRVITVTSQSWHLYFDRLVTMLTDKLDKLFLNICLHGNGLHFSISRGGGCGGGGGGGEVGGKAVRGVLLCKAKRQRWGVSWTTFPKLKLPQHPCKCPKYRYLFILKSLIDTIVKLQDPLFIPRP